MFDVDFYIAGLFYTGYTDGKFDNDLGFGNGWTSGYESGYANGDGACDHWGYVDETIRYQNQFKENYGVGRGF